MVRSGAGVPLTSSSLLSGCGCLAWPEQLVGVSSRALVAWASGAAIGPSLAAPLLDLIGPAGLFLYAAAVASALALFVAWRIGRRAPVPPQARESFVSVPATSPALAEIDPRVPERSPAAGGA